MSIAISSITTATNNGSTATISVTTSESPAVTQVGDLVIVIHSNDFYTLANMPTPTATGSPTLTNIVDSDAGTNQGHIRCWFYYANTGGAQTVSVTETGAHDEEKFMAVYVITGAVASSPVDGTAANNSTTQVTSQVCNSISPANSDSFCFQALAAGTGVAAPSYTPPGGTTKQYDQNVGGGSHGGGTIQLVASGATGNFTWTVPPAGTPYASATFAIKTAAGGATVSQGQQSTNRHPGKGPGNAKFFQSPRPTQTGNIVNIDGSLIVTANRSATIAVTHTVGGSLTVTANRTATVAVTHTVGGSLTVTANRTATAAVTHTVGGTRPITVGLAATVAVTHTIGGSRPETVNRAATVAVTHTVAGTRPITVGLTASIITGKDISGSRPITVNRTATIAVTHTIGGSLSVVCVRSADASTGGSFAQFLPFF